MCSTAENNCSNKGFTLSGLFKNGFKTVSNNPFLYDSNAAAEYGLRRRRKSRAQQTSLIGKAAKRVHRRAMWILQIAKSMTLLQRAREKIRLLFYLSY